MKSLHSFQEKATRKSKSGVSVKYTSSFSVASADYENQ